VVERRQLGGGLGQLWRGQGGQAARGVNSGRAGCCQVTFLSARVERAHVWLICHAR
jgi:hypothetical protein